ncbi:MAG TPA: MBL fold metallo-hydrolase [bacterium]|nr:MBL fold metallo-hydrolase [bacterium]
MYFQNIYEKGLAQASYLIGCQATGTAIVIDPRRDIHVYLEAAAREKFTITHVTETHIHADFLSGARELAAATGAELLLSDEGGADWQYAFPHTGLRDGSVFKVGNLKFEVMHTPGHTPEHIAFVLTDVPAGDYPIMFFSGDFVFVGDIGRPDLLEKAAGVTGTMERGAQQMFHSLKKFKSLPDHVQVWPGHGAGSACGKALGTVPGTTVGYEKLVNWALRYTDENEFVKELLSGQPEPPYYFAMMKKLNKEGPPILGTSSGLKRLTTDDATQAIRNGQTLIDTRPKTAFAEKHIPGAINIQNNNALSTWAGWILSYDKPFLILVSENDAQDVYHKLIRIGLDHCTGYITENRFWEESGGTLHSLRQIFATDLSAKLSDPNVAVIDVRGVSEYETGHIAGAVHIHGGHLSRRLADLPKNKTLIIQCQGGDRSSTATSLLLKNGFNNIYNLIGGIAAWQKAGLPVVKEK